MNELIGLSPAMRQALGAATDVASTPTTVLLTGETGTGKEALARHIHQLSPRASAPFTVLPGLSLKIDQLEAALAHGGTVVLDEVSLIPMETQGRLLGMLEAAHPSRVIATSSRDLRDAVEKGSLRSDLYYRLDVYPIEVPALRERREDIAALSDVLLTRIAQSLGRLPARLTGEALGTLESQKWNGNVRELANVLERATIRARGPMIEASDLGLVARVADTSSFPTHLPLDLSQLERIAIAEALRRTNGNRTHAAKLLNIGLRTLRQKLNGPTDSVSMEASAP